MYAISQQYNANNCKSRSVLTNQSRILMNLDFAKAMEIFMLCTIYLAPECRSREKTFAVALDFTIIGPSKLKSLIGEDKGCGD
ncbi:unnamed protein product [Ceratitis capitata]|uniref:(Mediterranean fruit fly) hypothetical protein n=1 Tax=Ceratitis capitata TaxID=7213 RepID=A0A811V2R0_CERCA|nr:unnamed protein product [Ceratitis capitata]